MNADDARLNQPRYKKLPDSLPLDSSPPPEAMRLFLEQAQPALELAKEYQRFFERAQSALERVGALEQAHQSFQELKQHPFFAEFSQQAIGQVMAERADCQLDFHYDRESDTLAISNGREVVSSADLSEEILAEFDRGGRPAGFVIDGAAELLKPYLLEAMLQMDSEPPSAPAPGG